VKRSADHPTPSAKNETGDFARFNNFVDRVLAVPHSTIKERLDAEKQRKQQMKQAFASARASREKR
jgi:hypothetical protein